MCQIHGPEKREGNNGARDTSAARDTTSPAKGPARTIGPYWVFRDRDDCLIFDAGPVGADHLPAHAHADLLTLEASIGGRRLLVDSGVFDYEDGPMRSYCRSTAAHNVLAVDDADQCDLWSRFRMGYRGHPGGLGTGQCGGFAWTRASHDAYRRLGVPQVSRWIACRPGGPWLCVDWAYGRGRHELTSRLHLHPDVIVRPIAEHAVGLQFAELPDRGGVHQADHEGRNPNGGLPGMLRAGARRLRLTWLGPGTMRIATGWYCPRFGLRRDSRVLEWTVTMPLPGVCAWCLRDESLAGKAEVSMAAAGPVARWADAHGSTDFNLAGM